MTGLVAAAIFAACGPEWAAERANVERAGNELIKRIESYQRQSGSYPPSLAAAHIENPPTAFGPFKYTVKTERDRQCAVISAGDYAKDGGTLWWDTCHPGWIMDD